MKPDNRNILIIGIAGVAAIGIGVTVWYYSQKSNTTTTTTTTCPSGDVSEPCQSGYQTDPNNPGCCMVIPTGCGGEEGCSCTSNTDCVDPFTCVSGFCTQVITPPSSSCTVSPTLTISPTTIVPPGSIAYQVGNCTLNGNVTIYFMGSAIASSVALSEGGVCGVASGTFTIPDSASTGLYNIYAMDDTTGTYSNAAPLTISSSCPPGVPQNECQD